MKDIKEDGYVERSGGNGTRIHMKNGDLPRDPKLAKQLVDQGNSEDKKPKKNKKKKGS